MIVEGAVLVYDRAYPTRLERALRAYIGVSRGPATAVDASVTDRAA